MQAIVLSILRETVLPSGRAYLSDKNIVERDDLCKVLPISAEVLTLHLARHRGRKKSELSTALV